ncbi:MAG TPA: pyruvate dehydrogenase (acetyl-transferring) E1 component subunit alpha [Candidatus Thermoplasmatota archaeon]|jgi:2-oxoisovalerate dehydrogenase E1 component alpha subunit|nr:pyruvate dehydrogenase (acetyl-transferring) E1 component subunit alpha [Candidatus Thermoplasmatota archaeon]
MNGKLLQVVRDDGQPEPALEPKLSEGQLKELYKHMLMVRLLDERGMLLQRQGRLGFYIGAEGQEAVHVGAGYALDPEDWYYPHYRDPGVGMMRGVTFKEIAHQLYGNAQDAIKGRQMPNHFSWKDRNVVSLSSPLSTQIPQAAGTAYAMRYRGEPRVVMACFGDGSTSEGDFHVGLNFAAVWKCPVVFLCNNNQWAISVPMSKQTASETIAIKALAYGMEGIRVDGNDVLAVYRAAKEAVDRARSGQGPTLIEAVTYRMGPHSSSDDASRYTPKEDLEAWKAKDPILRFERYLQAKGMWDQGWADLLRDDIKQQIAEAIKEAEAVPRPSLDTMIEDVYESPLPVQREQLDELKRTHPEGS